ncbi:protein takeout-like, partial [Musca vetustissima]
VPGLKNFGTIDPLHVKRVVVAEDGNSPVSINLALSNIEVLGFSNTKVLEASFDQTKYITKLKFVVPDIKILSDYEGKGRVLTLPLNGNGKAQMDIKNLTANVICKLKRRDEYGMKFTDIQKVRMDIDVGGFHINLENLFNGQEVLEQTANNLFNDNWKELFEALRPSITATIQTVLEDRYKKLFAYIPATYFIEDLE